MDGPNPLVSIVIPCYNQGMYLRQAIESVLSQDYPRIEPIVLDDGSTDDTRDVLAAYSGKFQCGTHANMGQAGTLNKGWRMSKGQILSYLAADDFLLPGAVTASVEKLTAHPEIVLTYSDFNIVDPNSRVLRQVHAPDFSYWDLAVTIVCQPGPGVFFRRAAFERAGSWNEALRQVPDYEYWLRLGLEGPFARIPAVLAAYRVHDRSQSFAPVSPSRADEVVEVISAHFRRGRLPAEIAQAESQALSNAHIVSARLHLRSSRYLSAMAHMKQAFLLDPSRYLHLRTWQLLANGLFNRVAYKTLSRFNRLFARG
jgi:glycosyltransferase involved in cell wall biosynthesis